jgi:hypothetical protein
MDNKMLEKISDNKYKIILAICIVLIILGFILLGSALAIRSDITKSDTLNNLLGSGLFIFAVGCIGALGAGYKMNSIH